MKAYKVKGKLIAKTYHNCPDCEGHQEIFSINKMVYSVRPEDAKKQAENEVSAAYGFDVFEWDDYPDISELPEDQYMRLIRAPAMI